MAFNPDQMVMAPAHRTLQTTYQALSAIQEVNAGEQVMAHTVLFFTLCQELRLDPSEMLDKARRLTRHAQDHYSLELNALREYIQNELKAK